MKDCISCGQPVEEGLKFCGNCGASQLTDEEGPSDGLIGQTLLNQYVMERKLGEGGMGTVYLADQPSMDRKAVVKVLHPHLTSDEKWVQRFNREAKIASKLSHPNSITLYNYGRTDEGFVYIAMEYVEGPALSDLIEETGTMQIDKVLRIAKQACGAMQEAHDLDIIHRDLKPDNVLVATRGGKDYAKVLDFGIAKMKDTSADEQQLTATGMVFGTPAYMSPEQFSGEELDSLSDLYSLGVMVYEMLVGKRPFNASTPIGYFKLHLEEDPPPMASLNPEANIPPAIEAEVRKALAKDKADRHANAEAFADALEEAARSVGAPVPEVSRVGVPAFNPDADQGLEFATGGLAAPGSFLDRLESDNLGTSERSAPELPAANRSLDGFADFDLPTGNTGQIVDRPPAPSAAPAEPWAGSGAAAPAANDGFLELAFQPSTPSSPGAAAPRPGRGPAAGPRSGGLSPSPLARPGGRPAAAKPRPAEPAEEPRSKGGGLLLLLVLALAAGGVGYVVLDGRGVPGEEGEIDPDEDDGDGLVSGTLGGEEPASDPGLTRPLLGDPKPDKASTDDSPVPAGMVRVPAGEYRLGGDPAGHNPVRKVRVQPFFLDRDEVTNEEHNACVAERTCRKLGKKFAKDSRFNGPRQPVIGISFKEATAYCKAQGKRLPSADEWEAAARGPEGRLFPWGDTFSDKGTKRANVVGRTDGYGWTATVGSFSAGRTLSGARDMAGNAAEWVVMPKKRPSVRGGSFKSEPEQVGAHLAPPPSKKYRKDKGTNYVGFRCAKSDQ